MGLPNGCEFKFVGTNTTSPGALSDIPGYASPGVAMAVGVIYPIHIWDVTTTDEVMMMSGFGHRNGGGGLVIDSVEASRQGNGFLSGGSVPTWALAGTYRVALTLTAAQIDALLAHAATIGNPHATTAAQVGAASLGHSHSGLYEPALGAPSTSGLVLASTSAGVRSWVSVLAGSGTQGRVPVWSSGSGYLTNSPIETGLGVVRIGGGAFGSNGVLQVAGGGIGLDPGGGTVAIRQASNSDGNGSLHLYAQRIVLSNTNSGSYTYTGAGLLAALSNSDGLSFFDLGRSAPTDGRVVVENTTNSHVSVGARTSATGVTLHSSGRITQAQTSAELTSAGQWVSASDPVLKYGFVAVSDWEIDSWLEDPRRPQRYQHVAQPGVPQVGWDSESFAGLIGVGSRDSINPLAAAGTAYLAARRAWGRAAALEAALSDLVGRIEQLEER